MKDSEYVRAYYNKEVNIKRYGEAVKIGLWKSEKTFFERYLKKEDHILDLGCGAGRTTFALIELGYKNIVGVDIAEKLIAYAKQYAETHGIDGMFEVGDATKLKYPADTFDAVLFSYNGMQCIPGKKNREAVLKEVYRVLKPNGYYLFTAHDRHDPGSSYLAFWRETERKWEKGIREKDAECLGDLITVDRTGEETFLHFSTIEEMEEFVKQKPFEIMEHIPSYDLAEESEETRQFAGDTVFWAIKKIEYPKGGSAGSEE